MDTMLLTAPLPPDILVHAKEFGWKADCLVASGATAVVRGTLLSYPFIGTGSALLPDGRWLDCTLRYVLTPRLDMLAHVRRYAECISLPCAVGALIPLLRKYACQDLALQHTFDGHVMVQYLGVAIEDFVAFLHDFGFCADLAAHAAKHARRYADLVHEIAIVYSLATMAPVSAAFHGVV